MVLNMLFDNYDLLMDSPNSTVKVRKLILQLAVQGKLVEQDPNDEPASELLKRIKAEKEKLIAEGKIKKQKPLPPITKDEIPYELPQGWKWSRLGKILTFEYGKGLTKQQRNGKGDIPVYGSNGIVGYHDQYLSNRPCIIIGRKGSSGALNICYTDSWTTDVAYYCSPPKELDLEYIYITLKFLELEKLGKGIKPGLNRNEAYLEILSIPYLSEQKRIVSKVDQLMQLCDQLDDCQEKASTKYTSLNDAALEKLLSAKTIEEFAEHWQFLCNNFDLIYNDPAHVNKLRQAILQLAVQGKLAPQDLNDEPASELLKRIKAEKEKLISEGKLKKQKPLPPITEDEIPYELPEGWEWVRLGEIGKTQTGSTPPTSKREYYGNDYAFIKPADISGKGVRYEGGVGLSKRGIEKGRFVKAYSVLMVCIGGSIGKVNFVDRDCSCNQQINAVTPYNDVDFCIVNYNLASPYFQNQVLKNAPSTTLPILSKGKWENIPFPLPPLAEQKRIVAKVNQLMHLCDELETRLNQSKKDSEMLIQAVLHEAFS